MDQWVDTPVSYPFRCRRTLQDDAEHGPYFMESVEVEEHVPMGGYRPAHIYHSRAWIEQILRAAGSPFACVTVAEHEELVEKQERLAELEQEAGELRARVAVLEDAEAERDEYARQLEVIRDETVQSMMSAVRAGLDNLPAPRGRTRKRAA